MSSPKKHVIHLTSLTYDDGAPPMVNDKPRYCPECGKRVSKYKDAWCKRPYCYAHDHLTPWTTPYIMGSYDRGKVNKEIRSYTGKGRGYKRPRWYDRGKMHAE